MTCPPSNSFENKLPTICTSREAGLILHWVKDKDECMLLGLRCKEEKGKKEMPLGRESELKLNNKKVNSRRLMFKEDYLQAYSSCGSHSPT